MTQEDKELLLKDLCARIPYGIICHISTGDYKLLGVDGDIVHIDSPVYDENDGFFNVEHVTVIPFLRPISSMTDEEKEEYQAFFNYDGVEYPEAYIDWLNKKMFDYRKDDEGKTMIEKGLALQALEGMYKHFGDMNVVVTSVKHKNKL